LLEKIGKDYEFLLMESGSLNCKWMGPISGMEFKVLMNVIVI